MRLHYAILNVYLNTLIFTIVNILSQVSPKTDEVYKKEHSYQEKSVCLKFFFFFFSRGLICFIIYLLLFLKQWRNNFLVLLLFFVYESKYSQNNIIKWHILVNNKPVFSRNECRVFTALNTVISSE